MTIRPLADRVVVKASAVEETTKESIKNDEGLVYPQSKNQLEFAVIFKVFEKIINYFISFLSYFT